MVKIGITARLFLSLLIVSLLTAVGAGWVRAGVSSAAFKAI
jgi:hypothetical protein